MSDEISRTEDLLARAEADTDGKTSVSEAARDFTDAAQAAKAYRNLREKLFHINRWNDESEAMNFALFTESGEQSAEKFAEIGNFIRITLPGTGRNDWVKIIAIVENPCETVITVQPTFNPTETESDKQVTSHFFTDDSTNNFCLRIDGAKIYMSVIGLNEVTNTGKTKNFIESARNLATANFGHFFGVQKAAWTTFCRNFLKAVE